MSGRAETAAPPRRPRRRLAFAAALLLPAWLAFMPFALVGAEGGWPMPASTLFAPAWLAVFGLIHAPLLLAAAGLWVAVRARLASGRGR